MMFATVLQGRQSTFYHILVIFIESVLQMLPQFQDAYRRLPVVNITPSSLHSLLSSIIRWLCCNQRDALRSRVELFSTLAELGLMRHKTLDERSFYHTPFFIGTVHLLFWLVRSM